MKYPDEIEIFNGEGRKATRAEINIQYLSPCKYCGEKCYPGKTIPGHKLIAVSMDENNKWRLHFLVCTKGRSLIINKFEDMKKEIVKIGNKGKLNQEIVEKILNDMKNHILSKFTFKPK